MPWVTAYAASKLQFSHLHVAAAGLYTKTGQKTKDRVRAPPLGHCARIQSWPPTHLVQMTMNSIQTLGFARDVKIHVH